ncbi:unnamed protein product [Peronospora farinosa]|uniref:Spindle pole body component n=1 Tax=Peronospora farinosa TaxID=134698 RepID=A0ABN8BTN8_9STRA|nr:unnamed protein product [Peronospora farinosa]
MTLVPSWTQEWRPLLKQLCAHINDNNEATTEVFSLLSPDNQLLRTDRVLEQLYSRSFVDCVPQDVHIQLQALAVKFRVHSLDDRADQLLQLAVQCDSQVLKLLFELATSPTSVNETDVTIDQASYRTSKKVIKQDQMRQKQEKRLTDQLISELYEISATDEWYEAWNDSDEDESDWDRRSIEEKTVDRKQCGDTHQCNVERGEEVMEERRTQEKDVVATSLDSRVSNVLISGGTKSAKQTARRLETERMHQEKVLEEETMQDELLRRYYPEITLQDKQDETDDPTYKLNMRPPVPFTLERPWLLCQAVVKRDTIGLILEETVVRMVFDALHGADSLLFEFHPITPTPSIFSIDFRTKVVERSRRSLDVAVGHLSPLALQHVLSDLARAASELQLLRDLTEFIRQARDLNDHHRCVTLEGLANSLSVVIRNLDGSIRAVEQQTNATARIQEESPCPWSGANMRQPTLLGIYGGLKENFRMISWLKRVLVESFQELSGRQWHEVKRAEQAKCVLDSLYYITEVEYIEGVAANANTSVANGLSRSDVLLHLFVGALIPYLDRINRMVFEAGHFETIPLDKELFFVTHASLSDGTSPTCGRNQSFREGLLSLAPFQVNQSLVPTFLESKIELMNKALASRQIKNRYVRHQQYSAEESVTKPDQARPALHNTLTTELETMGYRRNDGVFSMTTALEGGNDESSLPSQQLLLECVPFSRILERCLTRHLEIKCRELNGEIADIFRDKMNYMEHVAALRMFVLMEQQDVFNVFSEKIVTHMQENPVAWADSEALNTFHQSAVQGVFEDNLLSSLQRQIGGQLCVRVDFNLLDSRLSGARIDIATMKCMYFTFSAQPPLHVLFSTSIMQKYSRLGVLLVQVKAVESALVKFKSTLRHCCCYALIERDVLPLLLQIADMLHYTKSLLSYLTSQISSEGWSGYRRILQSSRSLEEMDATHEEYLDYLLNRFFLLDKHATVIQYILTTFNHILRFVGHVGEFVSVVDRNMRAYFPECWSGNGIEMEQETEKCTRKVPSVRLLEHPVFRILRSEMTTSSKEFKRQSHFLVVMLTAMQKHGALPHVNELVTQLNYNYFYHRQEH